MFGTWEVISYGGGELLRVIFNGVAMIMGDDEFKTLVRLFMLVGLLWVLGGAAFNMRVLPSFTWLLGALAVVYIMLVPKVNVMVVDRLDPSASSVVSNVPVGVGVTASFVSHLGDWLTRSFETVFSMPDDLNYSKNGMLFGQRLVEASTRVRILDARVQGNFQEFFNTCVLYDTALGLYSWTALQTSENLIQFLGENTSIVRRYYHRYADDTGSLEVCREGFVNALRPDLDMAIEQAERRYAMQLFGKRANGANEALSEARTVTAGAYNYLAKISSDAAEIMRQNVMINAMRDAAQGAAVANDATAAAISYATARAEAERRITWRTMGEMALRTLPLLRNIFEALMYAVFPIVLLMALIAPKQAIMAYGKSLVWVQLWAPLYAVLHAAMSLYSGYAASGAVDDGLSTPGITVLTSHGLGEAMADMGYIAGYLAMSIPMLAYMLVNQGGMMMANLAGGVMQGIQSIAQRGAEEATTGNISMGNLQQDNINWFKNDRSVLDSRGHGSAIDSMGNVQGITQLGSRLENSPISAVASGAIKSAVTTQAGQSASAAVDQAVNYSNQLGQTAGSLARIGQMLDTATSTGHQFDRGQQSAYQQGYARLQQLAGSFAETFGYDKSTAMQAMLALSGRVSGGFEVLGTGVKTSLEGSLRSNSNATSSEGYQEQLRWIEQHGVSDTLQQTLSAGERLTADYSQRTGDTTATELNNSLVQTRQSGETLNASINEARSWQELKARIDEQGVNFSVNAEEAIRQYMANGSEHNPNGLGATRTDELLARARHGDMQALGTVSAWANDWAREQGTDLARVVGAPTADDVDRFGHEARGRVEAATPDLVADHQQASAEVSDQIQSGGQTVRNEAGQIAGKVQQVQGNTDQVLGNANAGLNAKGRVVVDDVKGEVIGGQNAATRFGDAMGGSDVPPILSITGV